MRKFSDTEIVTFLQSSDRQKEDQALTFLHRQLRYMVNNFVIGMKGNLADAEDVLQEGLVLFFKMARKDKLPEELNAEAYTFTICKNLWYKTLKKRQPTVNVSELAQVPDTEDVELKKTLEDEKPHLLNILKKRIGDSCYQMLVYFYYESRKMKEIATLFSFDNEQVAKNKKAKCMKKLRELIQQEPALANAFR